MVPASGNKQLSSYPPFLFLLSSRGVELNVEDDGMTEEKERSRDAGREEQTRPKTKGNKQELVRTKCTSAESASMCRGCRFGVVIRLHGPV